MAELKNSYELTYIVNAVINDDQIKSIVQRVQKYIEENGGTITDVDEWGSRRLAYPINKKRNGHYVNLFFESDGNLIPKLERALEIEDDILRYLTLRMDSKMLRYHERRKQRAQKAETADAE